MDSTRLEFKDPDSLTVVQNLGSRGQQMQKDSDFFWLRYKAKNSYGAFTSANMACGLKDGKWTRDLGRESSIANDLYISYLSEASAKMDEYHEQLVSCKSQLCRAALRDVKEKLPGQGIPERVFSEALKRANEDVYESLKSLASGAGGTPR